MKGKVMEQTYRKYLWAIIVSITLIMILQVIATNAINAQGCGTSFPVGGAQGGAYASGGEAKFIFEPGCPNNILQNWSFIDGAVSGAIPSPGQTSNWTKAYGTPDVRTNTGCGDSAFIGMWGNRNPSIGEALQQTLAIPFVQGTTYSISFCAIWIREPTRPLPPQYAFRASNVPLTNSQDPNGVLIGVSEPVTSSGWVTANISPNWVAPDNYSILTVSVTNQSSSSNGDSVTYAYVDRICVQQQFTTSSDVQNRWNMVSVPVYPPDPRKITLFPTAISQAFLYEGRYTTEDTIIPLKGYWLKFPSTQTVTMSGYELTWGTVPVEKGWNMIGSLCMPIPVSSIIGDPPGMVTGKFFGYKNGYAVVDTIKPFKGYWIKSRTAGTLILSAYLSAEAMAKNAIRIVPTDELPPPPPDEITMAEPAVPKEYRLEQAYPNPFNPATTIKYQLPADSKISLKVYDLLGRVVSVLVDEVQTASYRSVEWNAGSMSSGLYFYRLQATSTSDPTKSFTRVKKMLLLK